MTHLGTTLASAREYLDLSYPCRVLHLAFTTPATWGHWAMQGLDDILLDHAHCEKKAASTALSLVFRYQTSEHLMRPLSALAREELAHFELVLDHLTQRGLAFQRQVPSRYAARLMEIVRKPEPERLIDTLLCCALIEARSCERMQLMAQALDEAGDLELARMYRGLLASEARHHRTYIDLIRDSQVIDEDGLRERLQAVAAHEAAVITTAESAARLHAGPVTTLAPQELLGSG